MRRSIFSSRQRSRSSCGFGRLRLTSQLPFRTTLFLVLMAWVCLSVVRIYGRNAFLANQGLRIGARAIRPLELSEGLKTSLEAGRTGGNGGWRSAARTAYPPDILAGNATAGFWREFLTVSLAHVLSELRKTGQMVQCQYDPSLYGLPESSRSIFIASNLRNNEEIMPNYITQLVQFLLAFPERRFFVSIYESGSTDATGEWLVLLREILKQLRIPNKIVVDGVEVRLKGQPRIDFLARVRNRALEPLWQSGREVDWDKIVFINDVLFCSQDIIRLLQHQGDIVCGLDFIKTELAAYPKWMLREIMVGDLVNNLHFFRTVAEVVSGRGWVLKTWKKMLGSRAVVDNEKPLVFYDIWVAHDSAGQQFSNHPPYVLNDTYGATRLAQGLPFPAQCCWNGMVVLDAEPFKRGLRFRPHEQGECATSECVLMCQDYQRMGFGRVVVDPGVRQAYDLEDTVSMYNPRVVQEIPALSWAEVQRADRMEVQESRRFEDVQCCPLKTGSELVDWKDCYLYDIWERNFTATHLQHNDKWLEPWSRNNLEEDPL